ncbi:type I-C CRISPR-associated protein Cas7/Csd2 [Deinococcus cellulosilyticus]|uniref:Type I-C CRISPR-associated protein Cas7/Csd2 n=1 Tax=Deinococcus cellulosilyticus (strain DSM 18568 / NBRC 106333 / KACC 11606 / 5516J-15) TaxID=1223518 RepID=A0A511N0E4_DEIC1|nr:type I-C CRISPR-associated protein Cas7/Csd2 [Deinococcus cellulosilyticus]GEM46313.1 type I-C CRISPR-associated protein Cas7/Csd2 [Deinococcus cellulosilyticus NBRC 106333 = KACC 11606]
MSDRPYTNAAVRHEFVLVFDVQNGNPNGDPDAGNLPRIDPETGRGIVTDVALKRKVRNYIDALKGNEERYKIYVQQGAILNERNMRAYKELGKDPKKATGKDISDTRRWMCDNFYDIRTFGAVMSTEINCGQVRGPIQLTFAQSVDPILGMDIPITRVALTNPGKNTEQVEGSESQATHGTMGRKAYVPYGLYVAKGFFVPSFATDTKFNDEDLEVFWQALINMWDLDRSASRGMTSCRGLYVFSHDSALGNAPAHKLLDRIQIRRQDGTEAARSYNDYQVDVQGEGLPNGVTLTVLTEG